MGIIIKGIVVIKRVATFPETRLRHFPSFCCSLEGCKVGVEDSEYPVDFRGFQRISEDGLLSTVVSIDRVLEAEEKSGVTSVLLANIWSNQLVQSALSAELSSAT